MIPSPNLPIWLLCGSMCGAGTGVRHDAVIDSYWRAAAACMQPAPSHCCRQTTKPHCLSTPYSSSNLVPLFPYLPVPVFRELYSEKAVVTEERRLRVDNAPLGAFHEAFALASLGNNYRHAGSAAGGHNWGLPGGLCAVIVEGKAKGRG